MERKGRRRANVAEVLMLEEGLLEKTDSLILLSLLPSANGIADHDLPAKWSGPQAEKIHPCPAALHLAVRFYSMKPRSAVAKRGRFGKTVSMLAGLMPIHFASVAAYWSTAVVGIQRPVLVSSGPPTVSAGKAP